MSCGAGGKWADPGFPKRGWVLIEIGDLGPNQSAFAICEMCEVRDIRYVHHVEHHDYPEGLGVGCVCGGRMTEDPAAAEAGERGLRNIAGRRARWLSRHWRESRKGNEFLNVDGFNISVFPKSGGWGGCVKNSETERAVFAKRTYPTAEAAKLAAFDAMLYLERNTTE
jgi:hypothetical protein